MGRYLNPKLFWNTKKEFSATNTTT